MGQLQFQPPPDWLMQAYMNQKSPAQTGIDGAAQVAQAYLKRKQLDRSQQSDALSTYVKAFEAGGPKFAADIAARTGLKNPPPLPGAMGTAGVMPNPQPAMQAQAVAPAPAFDPTQGDYSTLNEENAGMSMPSEHQGMSTSPILAHWHQTMGAPQAPSMAPAAPMAQAPMHPQARPVGSVPGFEDPESLLDMGAYGTKRLAAGESLGKYRSAQEANQPVSIPKYSALQSGDPAELQAAFGEEGIPRALAGSALSAQSRNIRVTTDPYGNPIRVPVAGGPATPINYPKTSLNPLQTKLNPNEYKEFTSEVNDFDKDKTVADNRVALNNMANVETMIKNYNPALTGPIASRQARAIAGEVGALTDSDIARQTLDPSVLGRLKKAVSVAVSGKLPQDQLNILKESIASIKKGSQSRIYSVAQERAQRLSTKFGGRVSVDELLQSMNLPSNFSSQSYGKGDAKVPTISNDADFNALPSGARFKDPSGTTHTKV